MFRIFTAFGLKGARDEIRELKKLFEDHGFDQLEADPAKLTEQPRQLLEPLRTDLRDPLSAEFASSS